MCEPWTLRTRRSGASAGIARIAGACTHRCPRMKHKGFTLTELVVVILLVGILAVVAIPRFADRRTFDERGFIDQARAAIQFARKAAVAQRRNVCVAVTANSVTLTRAQAEGAAAPCNSSLINPATNSAFALSAPGGVTAAPDTALVFDALGRLASPASGASIAVTGNANPITVERETGYVH